MKAVGMILCMIVCVLLSTSGAALASDSSFNGFLERFLSDEQFRMNRIRLPLIAHLGNKAVVKVSVERWSRKQIKDNLPLLLSKQELAKQGLKQSLHKRSNSRIEIFQYMPEADSYLLTYRFEKMRGNWFLTFFEDASL